jgi:membrane-associated protein
VRTPLIAILFTVLLVAVGQQTVAGPDRDPTPASTPAATTAAVETPAAEPAPEAGNPASSLADGKLGHLMSEHGPWIIFVLFVVSGVGLHLSEDFILIPAGFLAARGDIPLVESLIAAWLGLAVGDILWVSICRRWGTQLVQSRWFKRLIHPRRLLEAKHQMEERGVAVVALARFIPGTRTPVVTMAGILHMPWYKFLPVELGCALITVPLQAAIGYVAAIGIGKTESTTELVVWTVIAAAVIVAIFLGIHWFLQNRGSLGRAPRSRVKWLRTFSSVRGKVAGRGRPDAPPA